MSRVSGTPCAVRLRFDRWLYVAALSGLAFGCVEQADEKPTKEDEEFIKKNLLTSDPTPQFVAHADLDGKVEYIGVDVSPNPAEPGKDVHLTHYWKVKSAPSDGWRMFTHVSAPNGKGFINVDHGPISGKYPVSRWKAGDIIRDQHSFHLPPNWAFNSVSVYTGLWRGTERMPVKSGPHEEGRVVAANIPVVVKAPPVLNRYLVRKTAKPIKIDGKLDEPAWKAAPSTGLFVNTMTGEPAQPNTEAKLLWDNQNLYIAFENTDTDVWSTLTARDSKLWTQEMDEVMIDANGDGKGYIELQVAPNGTIFDTYLPTYRKYEDSLDPKRKPYDWNSKLKAAVKVDGTLNKRDDQDKGWTVEMALPLADANGLDTNGVKVPPALGDKWRLNMFRMDSPKDAKAQIALGWSAPLVGDFHKLDRFGEIVFVDEKGELPAAKETPAKDSKKAEIAGKTAEKKSAKKP
jgi:Carbohydrate family 9 binding domain-like